jgi:uncharacterized protein (TIGR03435 family)
MDDLPDIELLKQYAERDSQAAFAALVSRHVNLVYSAALRKTSNPDAAEEITQAVFVIFAQKAKFISVKTIIPGWLYQTARLTASSYLKREARRARREHEAFMQNELQTNAADETWREFAPLLEDAMGRLNEQERAAIVLRFLAGKSFAEVAGATGISENAAKKRVTRSLEKLRIHFARRGVSSTTAIIAGAISANGVQAAPVALQKSVMAAVATKGAAAGSSTLTLIKGALKIMAWTKMKTSAVVAVAVLLAAGTTTVMVKSVAAKAMPLMGWFGSNQSWAEDEKWWQPNSQILEKAPPIMLIRPTRFKNQGGGVTVNNRIMFRNTVLQDMISQAYGYGSERTIFPDGMPADRYDILFTLPDKKALQRELKKRFGYTAHTETRPRDVLLLKVTNPNPPNLHPAQNPNNSSMMSQNHEVIVKGQSISSVCWRVQNMLNKPCIDTTGLQGKFDYSMEFAGNPWRVTPEELTQVLQDQLGLALQPDNRPIGVLVVEKTK